MSWYDPALWDWGTISQTAIAAGTGSFAFTWLQRWLDGRKHGAYLALRLALILEDYASDCLSLVSDNRNFQLSWRTVGKFHTDLPDLREFPNDDNGWKALPANLAEKVLTFPSLIASSSSALRNLREFEASSDEELSPFCSVEAVERGLDAVRIAAELRRTYDYPQMEGDLQKTLADKMQEIRARVSRREAAEKLL